MHYLPLKKLSYQLSPADFEAEYQKRLTGYGSFQLPLSITPIQKGNFLPQQIFPLFLVNTPELFALHDDIVTTSQQIEQFTAKLSPFIRQQSYHQLLVNELQSTNEIEHVRSTKKELTALLTTQKMKTPQRFLGLVQMYSVFEQHSNFTLDTLTDFRTIYDILVADEIATDDQLDGLLFRKETVSVMASTRAIHRGVAPETAIINALTQLVSFMKDDSTPLLYRVMIMHYYFEYIHPFYDGNGRVGRYFIFHFLTQKLDVFSASSLTTVLHQQKAKYYELFETTSHPLNRGDMTRFCTHMLKFLLIGQQAVLADFTHKQAMLTTLQTNFTFLSQHLHHDHLQLLTLFAQFKLYAPVDATLSQMELTNQFSYSRQKLDKLCRELETIGYLQRIQQKPLIYTIDEACFTKLITPQ